MNECRDIGEEGAEDVNLRAGGDDPLSDWRKVGSLGRIDLVVGRVDAASLEQLPGEVYLRLGERIVFGGVGRRLGALRSGQRQDPLREADQIVRHRQGDVEDVVQALLEDRGTAAGALRERIAEAVGNDRGGPWWPRGETAASGGP